MMSRSARATKTKTAPAARASVSFPPEIYSALEAIAKQKKVSLAWVVREAAERYVEAQWPFLRQKQS